MNITFILLFLKFPPGANTEIRFEQITNHCWISTFHTVFLLRSHDEETTRTERLFLAYGPHFLRRNNSSSLPQRLSRPFADHLQSGCPFPAFFLIQAGKGVYPMGRPGERRPTDLHRLFPFSDSRIEFCFSVLNNK